MPSIHLWNSLAKNIFSDIAINFVAQKSKIPMKSLRWKRYEIFIIRPIWIYNCQLSERIGEKTRRRNKKRKRKKPKKFTNVQNRCHLSDGEIIKKSVWRLAVLWNREQKSESNQSKLQIRKRANRGTSRFMREHQLLAAYVHLHLHAHVQCTLCKVN